MSELTSTVHSDNLDGADFMELLSVQGTLDLITKTELIDWARSHQIPLTSRQITSYISEGLLPKTARIGSRVAYPKLVTRQLQFVAGHRRRGMSVAAVRELLPLFRFLLRAVREKEVSLSEMQEIVTDTVSIEEAQYAVPTVLQEMLPCAYCDGDTYAGFKFKMKDGQVKSIGASDDVSIGFALAKRDPETGLPCPGMIMRIALPHTDEGHNDSSIVLGLHPGEVLPEHKPLQFEDPELVGDAVESGGTS